MNTNISTEPKKDEANELLKLFNEKKFGELLNKAEGLRLIYPNSLLIFNILGASYFEVGDYKKSLVFFNNLIRNKPNYFEAYYNIGNVYTKIGKLDLALTYYIKSTNLKKDFFEAFNNIGNIYKRKNQKSSAIVNYIKSLKINPDFKRSYHNLAVVLQDYIFNEPIPNIEKYLIKILESETIVRPIAIANSIISYLQLNEDFKKFFYMKDDKFKKIPINKKIKFLSNYKLFTKLLQLCPIPNIKIEEKLREIRKEILLKVSIIENRNDNFELINAISTQCYLNEYIYEISEEEISALKNLEEEIFKKIKINNHSANLKILCLSCFKSLNDLDWIKNIKEIKVLNQVYKYHYQEKLEEEEISKTIKSIAMIKDNISIKVKSQYEENPYPRWNNIGLSFAPKSLKNVIKDINLNIAENSISELSKPEILIAGCGTGQHAITSASKYLNCNITAIDLSKRSLSYAIRKAKHFKYNNIKFLEGDILDLKRLNKKFNIIECVGVLHHMDDPYNGWKCLKGCLRDDGLMYIGLYSELARQNIKLIRNEIKKMDIYPDKKNIINFRNKIIKSNEKKYHDLKNSTDFYSLSALRDLIFHFQEHTFTLDKIEQILEKLSMKFIGFEDTYVLEKFKFFKKSENQIYNLEDWKRFENKNPRIFAGMYQFWCQKI